MEKGKSGSGGCGGSRRIFSTERAPVARGRFDTGRFNTRCLDGKCLDVRRLSLSTGDGGRVLARIIHGDCRVCVASRYNVVCYVRIERHVVIALCFGERRLEQHTTLKERELHTPYE